jgi:hypothetical protein
VPVDAATAEDELDEGDVSTQPWARGGTLRCTHNAWYRDIEVDAGPKRSVVIAEAGCDFRCSGCTLHGHSVIVASGDARVVIHESKLSATAMIALAKEQATVQILDAKEIDAKSTKTAFAVFDQAHLVLSGVEFEAPIGIYAKGESTVGIMDSTVRGSMAALRTEPGTTVIEDRAVYHGKVDARGTVLDSAVE